jgi:hypothetical protein
MSDIVKQAHDHADVVALSVTAALLVSLADEVVRLREALGDMVWAVCGETGFATAVRQVSKTAFPWPALDIAEDKARRALAGEQGDDHE